MSCIVSNQKSIESVNAGTAFRFAYSRAKIWKSWIWGITFFFAVLQTGASIFIFYNKTPSFDPTPYVVFFLILSVIVGSFGKSQVLEWQSMGCTIQRLHDFLVMGIGVQPTHIELPRAKVIEFSQKWLEKEPNDAKVFEEWWNTSLNKVPFPVAKVIATYSTFSWENELRKKYQTMLIALITFSLFGPLSLSILLEYTVSQAIIFVYAPLTPFISVILDELLSNKQSLKVSESLNIECHSTWANITMGKLTSSEIEKATERHMYFWQNFRQSATPIFDWFYLRSQRKMEKNMIVNTDELIGVYLDSLHTGKACL